MAACLSLGLTSAALAAAISDGLTKLDSSVIATLKDCSLSFSAASSVALFDRNRMPKVAANTNGKLIAKIQND